MGTGSTRTKSHDKESRRSWLAALMLQAQAAFASRMMARTAQGSNPNIIRDIRDTMLSRQPIAESGQIVGGSRNSGMPSRSRSTGAASAKRKARTRANIRKHPHCKGV